MRRFLITLLLVIAACGNALPDQGTIDVCTSIIGFDKTGIASAEGWMRVAQAGATVPKNSVVKKAAQGILPVDTAYLLTHGFSSRVKAEFIAAINRLDKACKDSGAYKGKAKRLYG